MLSEGVTPSEIFDEFRAQPPLQRAKFAEKYLGMEVEWQVRFADAWEEDAETVRVAFHLTSPAIRGIIGDVRRSDYPQLEHLRAWEPLRIRGRICSVSTLWIELDITELFFCLEAEPSIA